MGSCNKEEQRRLGSLVKNTVMLLSKDGITYQKNITIQGVLGITVDDKDVFIIHINETIQHPDTIPDESQTSTKISHAGHRRAAKRRRRSHSFSSDPGSGTVEEAGNNCSDTPHIPSDRPRQVEPEASVAHDNTSEPMVSLPHHPQTSQSANVIVIGPEAPVKQELYEPNFIVDNELSFAMRSVSSSLDSTTLENEALLNTPTTHSQALNITTTYNQPLNITLTRNQPHITTAFSQPFITGLVPNKNMLATEGPSSTSTNPSVSSTKPSLRSIKPKTRSNQPSCSPMAPSASSTTPSITRHTGQPGKSNAECGRDDQLHLKERMGEEEYKGSTPTYAKMSLKRKRVTLSVTQKLRIVDRLDAGEKAAGLMAEYGVGRSTISGIKKAKEQLRQFAVSHETSTERKSLKSGHHDVLDKKLYAWFCQERQKGSPLSGPLLKEKALVFHEKLHPDGPPSDVRPEFTASEGWLSRFKARHGIRFLAISSK